MAFTNEHTINVDIKRRMSNIVPTFKQGENAVLRFKVFDNNKLYDLTGFVRAEIVFKLPSGATVVGQANLLSNGLIEYTFTGVEMSQVGRVLATLSIYSGVEFVGIQPFTIHIYDAMKSQDLSYIGILQDLIAEVQILETQTSSAVEEINTKLPLLNTALTNEDTRNTNEAKRITDENTRTNNEIARVTAENKRISDETIRKNNETSRAASETQRTTNESNRSSAENVRATSEDTRKVNETARISEEVIRVSSEASRISNENARNTAESNRLSKESSRVTTENKRVTDENTRQVNEGNRASAESIRVTNETNRQNSFNGKITEVNTLISNAETTINNAQTVVNNTISVGSFVLGQAYKKNNLVLDNGSTFIALVDTQNNPLPILPVTENTWWRLVAQRGIDGTGSVSKVNNISPDVNGNVTLDLGDSITMVDGFSPNDAGNVVTHTNKSVLDKLGENNGEPTYNGKSIGKVSSVNNILPDTNGDIAIPSIHKGSAPPTKTINLWIDTN